MARRRLGKSEIRELNSQLQRFSVELSKNDAVEAVEEDGTTSYVVNGKVWFYEKTGDEGKGEEGGRLVPHLRLLLERPGALRHVTVDMGAVRFIVNGADVMRPGVVAVEDGIAAGDLVAVVDQQHLKPLAVGEALLGSEAMRAAAGGKVVRTLHHVGDKQWETTNK